MTCEQHLSLNTLLQRPFKGISMGAAFLAMTGCVSSGVQQKKTAEDDDYRALSYEVYAETNRLRSAPSAYAGVLHDVRKRISKDIYYPLNSQIGVRMMEGAPVVEEAITVISRESPVSTLQWSDALAKVAHEHVRDTGPRGLVSHESSSGKTLSERLASVMAREKFTAVAENIAFGYDQGRDVVAHLFVDDGVVGRGHRKNLLKEKLNYTGVACGSHRRYRHMCVSIYAYRPE